MQLLSRRIRMAGLMTVLATAAALVPALPASADECGVTIPCIPGWVTQETDIFGGVAGVPCGGVFSYEGDEGTRRYYSGPISGATYIDSDVDTRRMTVTCSIQTAETIGSGTVRGSTTAQSIAPLNNIVSAAGLDLEYWYTYPHTPATEKVWICTTVVILDHLGFTYTHYYDADPNRSGAQCLLIAPLVPAVAD